MEMTPACSPLGQEVIAAWTALPSTECLGTVVAASILQQDRKSVVLRMEVSGGHHVVAKRTPLSTARVEASCLQWLAPMLWAGTPWLYGMVSVGQLGWVFMADVKGEPFLAGDPRHRALLTTWVSKLHSATAANAQLGRPLVHRSASAHRYRFTSLVAALQQRASASESPDEVASVALTVRLIETTLAAWNEVEFACEGMPAFLVHGDLGAENLVVIGPHEERVTAIDWEDAHVGVPLVDLINVDLDMYLANSREVWPSISIEQLRRLQLYGRVVRTTRHALERKPTVKLQRYCSRLQRDMQALGWAR